ncbi:LacI family DNA-binding transcriptional regulator [Dactylosporangium siamense]|uniref:LacI family transcriptional regulator n=1 Tax=Dactylosporangium siamense TaxID=685454 RepID=A0A919UDU3_9ACTN|nr:LacI family DNA-binding transcriptional regulator [Dactylosporangium siamense]GIG47980.1 LacI family transcriptional regulator [Dactylosporangium siamense]
MSRSTRLPLAAIAAEVGVSAPTVSKVLNGRFDVAEATRVRVEAALARHGYAVQRSRAGGLIDLLLSDVHSPWADAIVRATVDAAAQAELSVVVSTERARVARGDWLEAMLRRGTDGLVAVVDPVRPADRDRLIGCGVPVVLLDPLGGPTDTLPSVGVTNWEGGLVATEHLIGLGHRRIGMIGGPREFWSTRARVEGYRAALGGAGLPADERLIRYGTFSEPGGLEHTHTLLDLAEPPTAIFCGNDEQAVGALRAALDRGLRVPQDLSLVGFDDIPVARWLSPALTTVRQPLEAMAAAAVRMLARQVEGTALDTHRVELSTSLVVRESSGPPR